MSRRSWTRTIAMLHRRMKDVPVEGCRSDVSVLCLCVCPLPVHGQKRCELFEPFELFKYPGRHGLKLTRMLYIHP